MFTQLGKLYLDPLFGAEMRRADAPQASQLKTLGSLLAAGKRTRFGADHGLTAITAPSGSMEEYRQFISKVPVVGYPELRSYTMRMVQGEKDVLWPGRCRNFAQSSGTSDGKSKYIPITPRGLQRSHYAGATFSVASYLHYYPHSRLFGGKNFILGGSFANELQLPRGVRVGDLSATLINSINPLANLFRVPSKEVALMPEWTEKLPRLVEAASQSDIRSISGVPSWFLTVLRQMLAKTGAGSVHDVWPNLEVFFHGGIAFGPYREQYDAITDPSRMHYWENYNASEGFFAVQYEPGSAEMLLLLGADTFYEFRSLEDSEEVLPAWELEAGKVYELIVTSSNGLWRYATGDTVKIGSTRPVTLTVAGRTKHFINAFGEEVMVHNTDAALARTCAATGVQVLNYTAAPVYAASGSKGRHQWLIEFATPPADLAAFAEQLDRNLQAENSDYQAKRSGNLFLDPLSVTVASDGLFDRWLGSRGKLGGQKKIPRLSNSRALMDEMLRFNDPKTCKITIN